MKRTLIIHPDMPGIKPERGFHDINGPSLIKVPEWIKNPLGKYYLYFAHHNGTDIRMAYADDLLGKWTVYEPGVLNLEETACKAHIASPDLHIDEENRRLVMYFHGPYSGGQFTMFSSSTDGLKFKARDEVLGVSYFRVFRWKDKFYASAFSKIYRSDNWDTTFELRKTDLFPYPVRHTAILLDGEMIWIFHSRYGDAPEHIMLSKVDLTLDWNDWTPSEPVSVLKPEYDFEGADLPLEPSVSGASRTRVRQLRDPAIYRENDKIWLLYSAAGEYGIAITEFSMMKFKKLYPF